MLTPSAPRRDCRPRRLIVLRARRRPRRSARRRRPASMRPSSPVCAGARSARRAAGAPSRSPAAAAGRTSTTSARPAAASGRPPTAASPGARSPTASSRHRRSAPSRSPSPTPTSSTSAWARSSCAATSSRATASTSRPTPARRGRTWASRRRMAISRIRVHPDQPRRRVRRGARRPLRPEPRARRLQVEGRRQDVGAACSSATTRPAPSISSMDPKNPDVLYAGFWEVFRTPHSLSSGGPGSGLFKTTDGGKTWTELTKNPGLPAPLWGKVGVVGLGRRQQPRLRHHRGGRRRRVPVGRRRRDAGRAINEDRRLRQRAFYYTRIYADPKARDTVYVLNTGLYRSTDAGKTLRGDPRAARRQPRSLDRPGRSEADDQRQRRRRQRLDQRRRELDRPGLPDRAVLQRLHDGARAVPRLRRAAGQLDRLRAERPAAASSTPSAAARAATSRPTRSDTDVFYAGSYGGLLTRINRRTGERRAINIWPDNPMGFSASATSPSASSGRSRSSSRRPIPKTLYATSQHVWKSTNEGQSWQRISPDLTRHDPSTLGASGGPITLDQTGVETYATVFTLAPSPLNGNVIWAGSDDGLVHVTRDAGKNWTNVTPAGLPDFTRISLIEASPHDAGTAYLAGNRYQRADRAPYVYKTSDYGKTLDEDRQRHPRRRLPARRARGPEAQGPAVPRHRDRRSTSRSTTAACGSRSRPGCR